LEFLARAIRQEEEIKEIKKSTHMFVNAKMIHLKLIQECREEGREEGKRK
jgi:hypothetical protein